MFLKRTSVGLFLLALFSVGAICLSVQAGDGVGLAPDSAADIQSAVTDPFVRESESQIEKVLAVAERALNEFDEYSELHGVKDLIAKGVADAMAMSPDPSGARAELVVLLKDFSKPHSEINVHFGVRVILPGDDTAYLLIQPDLEPDNFHFKKYIARQHTLSGPSTVTLPSGAQVKQKGRNVIVLTKNSASDLRIESLPNPKDWSWARFVAHWRAAYKPTTKGDVIQGGIFFGVVVHGILTAAMSHMKTGDISWPATFWTAGYGFTIGSMVSTYREWTSNPKLTSWEQTKRATFFSSLYAYGLVFVLGGDKADTMFALTPEAFMLHASMAANILSNNRLNKIPWQQLISLRSELRLNSGAWDLGPLGKWGKSNFENQMAYMIPWSINVISLLSISGASWNTLPGTDIHLPLAQLVGFFIARYVLTTAANYYSTKMNQALEYKGDLKQLRSQYDEKLAEFEDIHELYLQAEGQAKSVFEPDLKALADELYDLDLIITLGQKAIGSEEKTSRINRLAKTYSEDWKHLTSGPVNAARSAIRIWSENPRSAYQNLVDQTKSDARAVTNTLAKVFSPCGDFLNRAFAQK